MPNDQEIKDTQAAVFDLTQHHGWPIIRKKIVERILELQNVAEYIDTIQTGNATQLLREMKANKRAAEILFDWLRDVEGTGQQAIESKEVDKSYIYTKKD